MTLPFSILKLGPNKCTLRFILDKQLCSSTGQHYYVVGVAGVMCWFIVCWCGSDWWCDMLIEMLESGVKGFSDIGSHRREDNGLQLLVVCCALEDTSSKIRLLLFVHAGMSPAFLFCWVILILQARGCHVKFTYTCSTTLCKLVSISKSIWHVETMPK